MGHTATVTITRTSSTLPPLVLAQRRIGLNASIAQLAHRKRSRSAPLKNIPSKTCKYVAEQAKRRIQVKSRYSTLPVKATAVGATQNPEVLPVASTPAAGPSDALLPHRLARPPFAEVKPEALEAAQLDPNLPLKHTRDALECFGPDMLRSLISVTGSPTRDTIPEELTIDVGDPIFPPTHMLAVHGRQSPGSPLKVTMFPAHAQVFASQCAKLPLFPPSKPAEVGATELTLPVVRLPLPSPENYFRLSAYLYTKHASMLFASLMPSRPSESLLNSIGKKRAKKADVIEYAGKLAETFTSKALFTLAQNVQGLWKNVCALGIFDDGLWEVMDLSWWVLLSAIAISTGAPLSMIEDNRQSE